MKPYADINRVSQKSTPH